MNNNAVLDDGIIITKENRSLIDKFKNWYKERIIDTGVSAKFEKNVDNTTKIAKTTIKVVGTTATIILIFCPADGPFGEICTALATPALCTLVDKIADIRKNITIAAKRQGEKILGFEGQGVNPEVQGYNYLTDIVKDAKELKGNIDTYKDIIKPEEEQSRSM